VATEDDAVIVRTFVYLPSGELSEFHEREGRRATSHRFTFKHSEQLKL